MLSILNRGKKQSVAELLSADSICIIFNLVNHEALIAASMLHDVLVERGNKATLLDIRNALVAADTYIWVGCGDEIDLIQYYSGTNYSKKQLGEIMQNSLFVENTAEADSVAISDGMVVKAAELAEALPFAEGQILTTPVITFRRWAVASMEFHSNDIEKELYYAYSELLSVCYMRYHGMEFSDRSLNSYSPTTMRDIEMLEAKHAITNKALTKKVHEVKYGNRVFSHITSMGPDIYNLIRRLNMAKKLFMHVSESFSGGVIFSNANFETMKFTDHFRMALTTDQSL